jgi:hypothetical protein
MGRRDDGDHGRVRPFVPLDEGLTRSELWARWKALQRLVAVTLYLLANGWDAPWVWRGRRVGTIHRGELTHSYRTIAERVGCGATKDVIEVVVRDLVAAGFAEWIEPTSEPPFDATTEPTPLPTYKPTSPRKLRLVHYLRNGAEAAAEPPSNPPTESTPAPPSKPPPKPTKIRSTDLPAIQIVRPAADGHGREQHDAAEIERLRLTLEAHERERGRLRVDERLGGPGRDRGRREALDNELRRLGFDGAVRAAVDVADVLAEKGDPLRSLAALPGWLETVGRSRAHAALGANSSEA